MIDKDKLIKAYEGKRAKELVSAPSYALQGVSERDGELLQKSYAIETIEDMARCEFYRKALAVKRKAGKK